MQCRTIIRQLKIVSSRTEFSTDTLRSKQMVKLVPWGTDGRLRLSDLDLDLVSGHTVYRRASLIDLYLRTKFHWDQKKNFFESHDWGFGQVQSYV